MSRVERLFDIHDAYCSHARAIMEAKNNDYRSGTGDPYANFRGSVALGVNPITGILLRIQDKLCRVATFASKGELMVKGEGVDDALRDVINYCVLIGGLIDEDHIQKAGQAKPADRTSWALDGGSKA